MKIASVIIKDGEGERTLDIEQLPLRLGTGSDCEIRLPGPGSGAVALLDELDGEPFVQPVGRGASMQINGEELRTSRKLVSGDELEFFGTRIVIGKQDEAISLHIRLEDSAYVTTPPELPDSSGQTAGETIAPTAFQRASGTSAIDIEQSGGRWRIAVGAAIVILVLISSYLFTSKSIQFDVQPSDPDSLSLEGGWFNLPFGDRILMRPGRYTVHVSKDGYYDVAQDFEVDDAPSRTILIELRRLPGQLTITTDPAVDAIVTVDDAKVGRAPYGPLELEPGTHAVTVTAERFLPYAERLQVPGLGKVQQLEVQLVPQWANVEISSNPAGAAVFHRRMTATRIAHSGMLRLRLKSSRSVFFSGNIWMGSVTRIVPLRVVVPSGSTSTRSWPERKLVSCAVTSPPP